MSDRETTKPRGTHGISVRVGRIAGIEVYVDLSAIVIVALIAWIMATALPDLESGYSSIAYWAAGVVGAFLFALALLAHELSHSVVATRRGIEVRDITLWMLGGIATIEQDPRSANDELAVAIAGPAASLGIGAGLLAIGGAAAAAGFSPLFVAACAWLGSMNLFLAVFNLVPAAPLDGGRVLAAILWRRSGDRFRAARTAAHAGRVFAWCLFALGIIELFGGADVSGIWAVLLGWFVLGAASAEEARAVVEQELDGVRIRDIMTPNPVVAPDSITVAELLDHYVVPHHCTSFPIVHDGSVTGLATLARCRVVDPRHRSETRVRDIAWPVSQVAVGRPDELVVDVLHRGMDSGDGRILVFDDDRLVGIVSPSDIARVTVPQPS